MILAQICLAICLLALGHTYFIFPLKTYWKSKELKPHLGDPTILKDLNLSILLSAYNEEQVISKKLDNFLSLELDQFKRVQILIGSDASSDQTNNLIQNHPIYQRENFHFFPFENRRGKPSVINDLVKYAYKLIPTDDQHILLITDASVMLQNDVPAQLCKHFSDSTVSLVDSLIINTNNTQEGIGGSEGRYISLESKLKSWESKMDGKMIGPFGGCYSIRSTYFTFLNINYLVDDFYVAMQVFRKGGKCINELQAICYESNSSNIRVEFRRKKRIATGNFQNLFTFTDLLVPFHKSIGYYYTSHKVLRWLGPFFIIGILISSLILFNSGNLFFQFLFLFLIGFVFIVPILDMILSKLNINIPLFRSIRYFFAMNLAILFGFFQFLKGVKSGAWEPPKR